MPNRIEQRTQKMSDTCCSSQHACGSVCRWGKQPLRRILFSSLHTTTPRYSPIPPRYRNLIVEELATMSTSPLKYFSDFFSPIAAAYAARLIACHTNPKCERKDSSNPSNSLPRFASLTLTFDVTRFCESICCHITQIPQRVRRIFTCKRGQLLPQQFSARRDRSRGA